MWALRGLRNGILTTRWPARPDEYAAATRGPATVLPGAAAAAASADDLSRLCPARAIGADQAGGVRVDQGGCVLCGRCVTARPDMFGWSAGPDGATVTRTGLVVPSAESPASLAAVTGRLRERTRALRRSVHLRHVDAGSDGSEEWEILALLNPVYDIHRLGMFFTASPRHADILLATGSGAHGMAGPLREAYEGMPHPKVVIAVGTDAVGGGIVSPSYATSGGVGAIVPVDVWLPGSPPSPFAILSALLLALGRLPSAQSTPVGGQSTAPASPGDQL
jgi:Ni,Fe-hydrogenase III small subunit/ferredoxin-like protein FixX